jgi:hypothetical protein
VRAIARLETGLEEIFDGPARQLISETAAQLRGPESLRPYGTTGLDRNIGVVTKRPKVAEPPSSRGLALAAPEPHTKEAGHGGA